MTLYDSGQDADTIQTHGAVKLQRELAQVPITAVAFYRDPATGALYVLAGEDTDLVIYRVSGPDASSARHDLRTPVARLRILHAQPIHGIRVQQQPAGRLLLWGGSSVALLPLADLPLGGQAADTPPPRVAHVQAPDWIYDGAVGPADDDLAVLVTAHNEIVTVRLDGGAARIASALVSPSRPMLYAAHVCWTADDEVLVAAGTVFGDILVWTYTLGGGAPRMLYALSGHEGSIFGVHVSPLLELPGEASPVRLLASCSDDRTIRIWNITEGEAGEQQGADTLGDAAAATSDVSDTGFRCAPAVYGGGRGQGRADVKPIATAMGHASRIWGVQFGLPNEPALTDAERRVWGGADGLLSVYSFGEDATAQKWRVDAAAALRETGGLVHDKTYTLHDGKHLWSRALLCRVEDGVPTTRVLAGGADSKITLVTETADPVGGYEDVYSGAETWDMHDILAAMGRPAPAPAAGKPRKELIGRYDFITPDVLLAVTSTGRVLLGIFTGARATWEELVVEDETARADMGHVYALRTICYGGALLGCVTGGVYYVGLRDRHVVPVAGLAGRVVEISALSETAQRGATGEVEALIHLHRDAASVLLTLDRATGAVSSQETLTGLDSRFVAMCAARIDDVIAVGSRHGWIALLRRQDDSGTLRLILERPPTSSDAMTAIVPLPASTGSRRTKYVLTTSRDGAYRIFQLDVVAGARMTLLHETAPPFGPWIEGAWFTADAELVLYGFRSTDFVVWNETRREALAAWDCGGAHRTFRLARDGGGGGVRVAFTRTSRLAVHAQRGSSYEPVRRGGHGREVRSLAAAGRTGGYYVATGAEDTTIRLWACPGRGGALRPLACMKRHVAGLQKVQWATADGGAAYLLSSGGNEELFAWRVRALDSAYAGRVAVVCEGVFADKSAREDLRIMDFDASPDSGGGDMLLTMARSDSALRTYRYTAASGFALVCAGRYTGACLTQVRHLETSGGLLQVVTASTDGHLALWRGSSSTGTYELVQTLRVHQSSVKSLDMVRLADGYGVATGGDDNALAWTLLRLRNEEGGFRAGLGAMVERAHAAAVTGVALVEMHGEVRCVSVSNDQWVRTWRLGEGGMRLLGEAYSGVADAGDVVALARGEEEDAKGPRVMVAGVGLEVWRLE
ncbi:WD domain containing [Cordyceps militaris]|uniref:WD domain containing n=1 Tax=Cordyceps militaris TaxID=73501 RepID=A0A2H4S7U4_CORMI|nr:WD domain containing [Cordyceps militaris]